MEKRVNPGLFVPAFPTIGPDMLMQRRRSQKHYPLSAPDAHYFFFARNAIWHTVKMLELDRGEVLVPSYHHGVEIEALIDAGAQVKFYRIGEKLDVDLRDVERKISAKTTALYLTHFAGFPGPVREMKRLAEKYALPLIEDCALSLFSMDGDLPLGVTGDVAIFCLYKLLPGPNGGALVFNGSPGFESSRSARGFSLPWLEPPRLLPRDLSAYPATHIRGPVNPIYPRQSTYPSRSV
jgi:hypothetical protein